MSSSFITNKDKFLSDIINGILPKTDAVDFLVGYFYYSGYVQLSENLKSKHIRILVGLDIEIQISKHVCEVENFRQKLLSAHPTNPVECCADANPKTMLPNDT